MLDLHLFLTFLLAVTALMLFPGPNVALITSNSMTHGVRYGLLTVAGTSTAMLIQLAITALGLGAVLAATGPWFAALRWLGAGYLIYLGIQAWRQPATTLAVAAAPSPQKIFRRAILVSLTNPKTLFFYGAFLPQFISPAHPILPQMAALTAAFLAIALIIDSLWAITAHHARNWLARRAALAHRASGTILISAGLTLAFTRGK
jgi:threonine/homoserine/homoserine lactone efflux protein